jgi:hypothetical protein
MGIGAYAEGPSDMGATPKGTGLVLVSSVGPLELQSSHQVCLEPSHISDWLASGCPGQCDGGAHTSRTAAENQLGQAFVSLVEGLEGTKGVYVIPQSQHTHSNKRLAARCRCWTLARAMARWCA